MNVAIRHEARRRGITRLCHFTPSRNLVHIASGGIGILGTRHLEDQERQAFTATDLQRLDHHEHCISCSIEYPNSWYFEKARARETIFKDWVILFIDPKYLWLDGTLFCPRNASADFGRGVETGHEGFKHLFVEEVVGAYGRTYKRTREHLPCCPTDDQAEVLVPDLIHWTDVFGIAVRDEDQAAREVTRLELLHVAMNELQVIVAPILYDKWKLSTLIRSGTRPEAALWTPRHRQ